MPRTDAPDFSDLVESAAVFSSTAATPSLTTQLDGIPRLSRTLQQVSDASLDVLRSQPVLPDSANAVHANALRVLARRGFEHDRLRLAVERISEQSPFIPRTSLHRHVDGDAAQLLNIQRSAVASRAADEARLRANASFQKKTVDDMAVDLLNSRAELVELMDSVVRSRSHSHFSQATDFPMKSPRTPGFQFPSRTPQPTPRRSFTTPRRSGGSTRRASFRTQSPWTPRTPGNPEPMHLFSADPMYLSAIQSLLNEGDLPSVATIMHNAAVDKQERPHLKEIFAILANLASFEDVTELPDSHARSYAARSVLEDQFAELTGVFTLKPRQASTFAVRNDVVRYVAMRRTKGTLGDTGHSPQMFNGEPLWAQVFYCIRVGNIEAALEVIRAASEEGNEDVANFKVLLEELVEEKLRVQNEFGKEANFYVGTLLKANAYYTLLEEYRTKVWESGDAYMRGCYFLLARLELAPSTSNKDVDGISPLPYPLQPPHERTSVPLPDADFNSLFGSVEDYMWMRLFVSRGQREEIAMSRLEQFQFVQFEQVQREVEACGPAHFDARGSNPLLFAFVLTCVGLFGDAVKFLASTGVEQHIADAANIAVVLYILKWNDSFDEYAQILWQYIDLIKGTRPEDAATYVFTIRESDDLVKHAQRLVLETGEYCLLLGVPPTKGTTTTVGGGVFGEIISKMPNNFPTMTEKDLDDLRRNVLRLL